LFLEIFKTGKHTSSNGVTKEYTQTHLSQIAENLSDPVPIVVGHPKDNSPAFGWIKNLSVKGESLFADASDLVPEFLDLLKQKIYSNRSVSLKENEDGTLSLNHVGFLGGMLPAVKGLEALNLNSESNNLISYEFSESETQVSNPKNFSQEIVNLKSDISLLTSSIDEIKSSIAKDEHQESFNALQSKIDELNLKLDSAYFQRNITEKLQMDNLTPAIKSKILSLLDFFETLNFSDDKQSELFNNFQELIELIKPFQLDEVVKRNDKNFSSSNNEFSELNVDEDSLKLFNKATLYAKENDVTFNDAINFLTNNNETS